MVAKIINLQAERMARGLAPDEATAMALSAQAKTLAHHSRKKAELEGLVAQMEVTGHEIRAVGLDREIIRQIATALTQTTN